MVFSLSNSNGNSNGDGEVIVKNGDNLLRSVTRKAAQLTFAGLGAVSGKNGKRYGKNFGNGLRPSVIPSAVGPGVLALARAKVWAWDRALVNLRATQEKQLFEITRHARNTQFGRAHNFDKLRSYEDFRAAVPLGDYDTFDPYIQRMRAGERGLLVPEFVRYFGNSSGSSNHGKPKFLPVTERQIVHQMASSADALWRYLDWKGDAHFTDGYYLGLFPSTDMKRQGKVLVTCNPALMVARMPVISRMMYIPDDETMRITDHNKKLEVIAERYLDYDVRMITGTTCWFSVLFDLLLEAARKRGRKAETVTDLWPNLQVMIGGGVAAGPYRKVLRDRLGRDDVPLVDTYNATEGGMYAITDHLGGPGLLMVPHRGVFFEFVPVEELDADSPTRVPLWEVERNRLYAIVITTPSGLYAYKLGDLVRFPSLEPLRIEFAGRTAGCLSTTQELTTHVEIQQAVEAALEVAGGTPVDFSAGADVGVEGTAKARYVLFTEFTSEDQPADRERFIRAFDESLCAQNRVYREHRHNDAGIIAPELVTLPTGSVQRYLEVESGANVQTKFPRIVDDDRKEVLRSYGGSSTFAV